MARLDGKVAIITGGAGGIGKAAGALFVAEGASVMLVDLGQDALAAAAAEIGSNRLITHVADVTDPAQVEGFVAAAEEQFGGVDIVLANAGVEGKVAGLEDQSVEDFDHVINVNVKGAWLSLKYAFPALKRRGGGSIVITSSIAGVKGSASVLPYVTSKHAVIGMMRSAAMEGAAHNIRVNTVNPSPVETRMMRSLEEGYSPGAPGDAHDSIAANIPLGRYGEPDDIAKLMLFLASDDAAFLNGSVYFADGGSNAR